MSTESISPIRRHEAELQAMADAVAPIDVDAISDTTTSVPDAANIEAVAQAEAVDITAGLNGILDAAAAQEKAAAEVPGFAELSPTFQNMILKAFINAHREQRGETPTKTNDSPVATEPVPEVEEKVAVELEVEQRDDVYADLGGGRNTYYREGTLDPDVNAEVVYTRRYVFDKVSRRMVPGVDVQLGTRHIAVVINEGMPSSVLAADIERAEASLRSGHGMPIKKTKKSK